MHDSYESMQEIPGGAFAVLESITDAFFALNKKWEFTYLNSQAEVMLGTPRAGLLGRTLWEAYPGVANSEFELNYRKAAREQVASSFTSYYPDHDRWYEVHVYPSAIGLLIYFRNDTDRMRSQEKLRQSELRFRQMADAIPQIVWVADAGGNLSFFNRQWNIYTGAPIDFMPAADVAENFIHPEDWALTLRGWEQALRDGKVFNVEHRIRSHAGDYRWFLVRAEPQRELEGAEITHWFGTSTDIHDSKVAEAALKKSEQRYRSLFNSIDEGFCIIEMLFDAQGAPCDYRFLEINRTFEQQTGLHDATGKTMLQLSPTMEKHWFNIYGKVALTGEGIRFENEARAMGRWFDVYAFRIDEPAENRVAVLFKDVTAHRLADAQMRESELLALKAAGAAEAERQRLDAVLEAVPVGIIVTDGEGSILLANAANRRLWGEHYPLANGINEFGERKGWWADGSARHGQPLTRDDWPTARILRGDEALHDIIEIESFDTVPARHIVLNSGAAIRNDGGKIVGVVVAQMDITDRVKAEQALKQADRRKDEFLAMLAHELRNPLAPISAAADLLTLGLSEPRIRQTSAIISRQVRHMTGLVDDLLDVSRVTRGLVALNRSRLDAKRVVADAVEQVRPLIEARGHRLTVQTPPQSAFVSGDHKRLVQIMTNLLNNAAKYTREGGDIVLTVEVDDQHVRMIVADNGPGMTRELVERAFELFAQAERTSDRSQGGLGIGLALVKSLVELHGGTVTAFSAGLEQGSKFMVCLPHLPVYTGPTHLEASGSIDTAPGPSLKIMIVDDNADAADMLAMFTDALGHQVFVEHSSNKALARARIEQPEVFLLDIGLPDMDGNELARRLRAQPETARAVLVAVTGYGHEQDRNNAMDAGFDHLFVKPVDTAALARLLAEVGHDAGRR